MPQTTTGIEGTSQMCDGTQGQKKIVFSCMIGENLPGTIFKNDQKPVT
jgi:hypothetical protein